MVMGPDHIELCGVYCETGGTTGGWSTETYYLIYKYALKNHYVFIKIGRKVIS